ncbi:hypothetical protein VM1G_02649 [Cytospora mali]|uniref:Pt repeat family protein n=1 Tax=Cytospora mali TaxID=578113 RepID=A0A194VUG0_CYTMA|nr:hypothetical protein VM1G_02649 [Valsa mali]
MAWDKCRHGADPQPWTLRRPKTGVDELDFVRPNSISSRISMKMDNEHPLSPIAEEGQSDISGAPLQVKVILRFLDPVVRSVYNRTYSSSPFLLATDRICRGLLRRIDHCSEELITRKDSAALSPTQCLRKGPKDLRFEMTFKVYRRGHSGIWAERSFQSYQKQPLTSDSAIDIIRSTHNIIGVFLKRHDDHFKWVDQPSQEYFPDKPATFKPSVTGPLNLACIPRSRFIESTQRWEAVPGYTLEFTIEGRDSLRLQPDFKRVLKVDSTQTAPLSLGLAEDLLWQAFRAVEEALYSKKNAFDIEHSSCEGFDGVPDLGCEHYVEKALKVELRSVNNLGPTYEHLCRNIQSRLRLFKHPSGQDCDEFIGMVRACFKQLRDRMDQKLEMLNDFDLRIAELIGHGWHVKNPARFIIDGKQTYTRRSIEALLDRIRTGVGDVLRGHDVAIRMIAYKRGHLILDKALISRTHQSSPDHIPSHAPEHEQRLFVALLTARIQEDIDMICKDTCNLEDIPDVAWEPEHQVHLLTAESRPFTPRSMASQSSLYTAPGSPGLFTQPPVPPSVPSRKSSRVFPLVPTRYKDEEEHSNSATTSARDFAVGTDLSNDHHALGGASNPDSSANARVPHFSLDNHREESPHGKESFELRPAPELKRSRDDADDSSSSILTYSSMPALTESETPSPGQSMLITPECVRTSPQSSSSAFFNDSDSSPLMMATSDTNSDHFPEPELLTESKADMPKSSAVPFGRPLTPLIEDVQDSASPSTPKASRDSKLAETDSVARTSQQARQAHKEGTGMRAAMTDDVTIGSALHDTSAPDAEAADVDVAEATAPESTQDDFPTEGWLLHCEESGDEEDTSTIADLEEDDVIVGVEQCDSSEALKPGLEETDTEPDSKTALFGEKTLVKADQAKEIAKPELEQVDQSALSQLDLAEDHIQPSEPTETPVSASMDAAGNEDACGTNATVLPKQDEVSRSKAEEDNHSIEPENHHHYCPLGISVSTEPDLRPTSVPEVSETGHTVLFPDSVMDAEQDSETTDSSVSDEHVVLPGQVEECASVARLDVPTIVLSGPETCITELEVASDFSDAIDDRDGVQIDPETTSWTPKQSTDLPDESLAGHFDDPVSVADQVTTSGSILPTETVAPLDVTPSTRPSSAYSELENNCPQSSSISKLGTGINQSRSSLASSEWEDCVSERRKSIDSVDSFGLTPSEEDDEPQQLSASRRLGTSTAGFLGLPKPRWADFGIRSVLTGTHAFDKAPMAPLPCGTKHKAQHEQVGIQDDKPEARVKTAHARPASSHRKLLHLTHKKSNSSVIFLGPHIKLLKPSSRKESKELKVKERTGPKGEENSKRAVAERKVDDDSAARFPRAMMLVAGVAVVSSAVNRQSA